MPLASSNAMCFDIDTKALKSLRTPLISSIIPTFNRSKIVRNAIDSILNQTYTNIEIIVVDDGSTDDTRDILADYAQKGQITYIYQKNAGVSAARNAGLKIAKGEWIAFLDSDDTWLPDKLRRQMQIVENSSIPLGCVISNMKYDHPIGKYSNSFQCSNFSPLHPQGICHNISSILLTRFIHFNQVAVVKKVYIDDICGFDEYLEILEDYDFALKLSHICSWGYDTNQLVIYQTNSENSLSSSVDKSHEGKRLLQVFDNLKIFLHEKNIPAPRLLDRQLWYYAKYTKYGHLALVRTLLKLYGCWMRRVPSYQKPQTEEIQIGV
jgi:glycosyltransferase involved in cell wall biosynthesis